MIFIFNFPSDPQYFLSRQWKLPRLDRAKDPLAYKVVTWYIFYCKTGERVCVFQKKKFNKTFTGS